MTEPPEGMNPCVKQNLLETLGNSKTREKKKNCDDEFKTHPIKNLRTKKAGSTSKALTNILRANEESRKEKLDDKSLRELRENPSSPFVHNSKRRKKGGCHWDYMC